MDYGYLSNLPGQRQTVKPKNFSTSSIGKKPSGQVTSSAVQAFLARKQDEERLKYEEARQRKEQLLALRAQNSKNSKKAKIMASRTKDNDFSKIKLTEDELDAKSKREVELNKKRITNKVERMKARIELEERDSLLPRSRKRKAHQPSQDDPVETRLKNSSDVKIEYKFNGGSVPIPVVVDRNKTERKESSLKSKPAPVLNYKDLLQVASKKQYEPVALSDEDYEDFNEDSDEYEEEESEKRARDAELKQCYNSHEQIRTVPKENNSYQSRKIVDKTKLNGRILDKHELNQNKENRCNSHLNVPDNKRLKSSSNIGSCDSVQSKNTKTHQKLLVANNISNSSVDDREIPPKKLSHFNNSSSSQNRTNSKSGHHHHSVTRDPEKLNCQLQSDKFRKTLTSNERHVKVSNNDETEKSFSQQAKASFHKKRTETPFQSYTIDNRYNQSEIHNSEKKKIPKDLSLGRNRNEQIFGKSDRNTKTGQIKKSLNMQDNREENQMKKSYNLQDYQEVVLERRKQKQSDMSNNTNNKREYNQLERSMSQDKKGHEKLHSDRHEQTVKNRSAIINKTNQHQTKVYPDKQTSKNHENSSSGRKQYEQKFSDEENSDDNQHDPYNDRQQYEQWFSDKRDNKSNENSSFSRKQHRQKFYNDQNSDNEERSYNNREQCKPQVSYKQNGNIHENSSSRRKQYEQKFNDNPEDSYNDRKQYESRFSDKRNSKSHENSSVSRKQSEQKFCRQNNNNKEDSYNDRKQQEQWLSNKQNKKSQDDSSFNRKQHEQRFTDKQNSKNQENIPTDRQRFYAKQNNKNQEGNSSDFSASNRKLSEQKVSDNVTNKEDCSQREKSFPVQSNKSRNVSTSDRKRHEQTFRNHILGKRDFNQSERSSVPNNSENRKRHETTHQSNIHDEKDKRVTESVLKYQEECNKKGKLPTVQGNLENRYIRNIKQNARDEYLNSKKQNQRSELSVESFRIPKKVKEIPVSVDNDNDTPCYFTGSALDDNENNPKSFNKIKKHSNEVKNYADLQEMGNRNNSRNSSNDSSRLVSKNYKSVKHSTNITHSNSNKKHIANNIHLDNSRKDIRKERQKEKENKKLQSSQQDLAMELDEPKQYFTVSGENNKSKHVNASSVKNKVKFKDQNSSNDVCQYFTEDFSNDKNVNQKANSFKKQKYNVQKLNKQVSRNNESDQNKYTNFLKYNEPPDSPDAYEPLPVKRFKNETTKLNNYKTLHNTEKYFPGQNNQKRKFLEELDEYEPKPKFAKIKDLSKQLSANSTFHQKVSEEKGKSNLLKTTNDHVKKELKPKLGIPEYQTVNQLSKKTSSEGNIKKSTSSDLSHRDKNSFDRQLSAKRKDSLVGSADSQIKDHEQQKNTQKPTTIGNHRSNEQNIKQKQSNRQELLVTKEIKRRPDEDKYLNSKSDGTRKAVPNTKYEVPSKKPNLPSHPIRKDMYSEHRQLSNSRPADRRPISNRNRHSTMRRDQYGRASSRMFLKRIESDDEEDEDEDEEDDDMADFIDDGPLEEDEEDYSRYIREIFGYDKRRYRYEDDLDDHCMESSYAEQMKEERRSARIGLLEDLEDMKKEEEEKRLKGLKKQRK